MTNWAMNLRPEYVNSSGLPFNPGLVQGQEIQTALDFEPDTRLLIRQWTGTNVLASGGCLVAKTASEGLQVYRAPA